MSFKKNLEPENISITSFETHKDFTFTNEDSGSGIYVVPLIKGTSSNLSGFDTGTATSKTISASIFYKTPTYQSINALYYRDITQMRGHIDYIRGVPTSSDAMIEYTYTVPLTNPAEQYTFRRPFTRQLHDTANIISVPQKFYGEYIKPYSLKITDDSTASTIILRDDGKGNLYDVAFSASYAAREPNPQFSGSVVGNVFYDDGMIVITDTGSYSDVGTGEASDGFVLEFKSTQTIYEREYVCTVDENEFQHSNNKSLKVGQSGSIKINAFPRQPGKTDTINDEFPYRLLGFATGSYKTNGYEIGTELIGEATHSDFATYVTNIGLFNDENELLAIGKPAKPIKNDKELALTFVVRFDTN